MTIGFNTISANLVAPIAAFEVNSAGAYEASSRLVILGHKLASGTLADNTPARAVTRQEVAALAGAGSMLYGAWIAARLNAPTQDIWIVPVAESGVAATWTITPGTIPAAGGVGLIDVEGMRLAVTVAPGDTAAIVGASIADAINAAYDNLTGQMLHVTASANPTTGVVTVTARHKGAVSAEIDIHLPGDAGNLFTSSWITVANGTAGSGVPTLTGALAALGDDPADMIVNPWADATSLDAIKTALSDVSGRWDPTRMSWGHALSVVTGSTSTFTTLGLSRNDRHISVAGRVSTQSTPSWVMAAAFAAAQYVWLQDIVLGNVSRNQTGRIVQGVRAPRDRSLWPNYATRDTLNRSSVSTWSVNAVGEVVIDKFVTMQRLDAFGQTDITFRDIQSVFQVSGGLSYIKAQWYSHHGRKALSDANPRGLLALTTEKDQEATLIAAYKELCDRGVFENLEWFARNVTVKRNAQNPSRADAFLPIDRTNPLDIFAANATFWAQAPSA